MSTTETKARESALDAGPTITALGGRIGALVENAQLSGKMDPAAVKQIRDAVLRHKVVFLRNQKGAPADIEAFAELYGNPVAHPLAEAPEGIRFAYEMNFSKEFRADHWHTDFSFLPDFVDGGILYPVELPAYGGDTVWSNTAAAYDDLPPPVREMADQLWAVHSSANPLAMTFPNPTEAERRNYREYNEGVGAATRHPVVRVHPDTGERSLLLGNFIEHFEGCTRTPTNMIYELLQHYVMRPENTIRWSWKMGDIAIWDNRSSQHYGVRDFKPEPRVMRRISMVGSVPVGMDGGTSTKLT